MKLMAVHLPSRYWSDSPVSAGPPQKMQRGGGVRCMQEFSLLQQSTSGSHILLSTAIVETSNIELDNLMFKLPELPDGQRRQALSLSLHVCNLNQCSPFSLSQSAIKAEGCEYFQLKHAHLNVNNTQARVHYHNSLQLYKICISISCTSWLVWSRTLDVWGHWTRERRESRIVSSLLPLRVARLVSVFTARPNQCQLLIIVATSKWWMLFYQSLPRSMASLSLR